MGHELPDDHISRKRVLYDLPGTDAAVVRQDVEFQGADGASLAMDIYASSGAVAPVPAVVIAAGYRDAGYQAMLGCRFKDTGSSVSWAKLIAASGMVAITHTNRDPAADLKALVGFVRRNGSSLGVNGRRIGVLASSGNVPVALSMLMRGGPEPVACAALCYGYLLDLDGATGLADAAATFKFANPCAGLSFDALRQDVPLLVARAGQDRFPGLNASIDRFVAHALVANLPLTLVNHPEGPHAFELFDDSAMTRAIVQQILTFLHAQLIPAPSQNLRKGVGSPFSVSTTGQYS